MSGNPFRHSAILHYVAMYVAENASLSFSTHDQILKLARVGSHFPYLGGIGCVTYKRLHSRTTGRSIVCDRKTRYRLNAIVPMEN